MCIPSWGWGISPLVCINGGRKRYWVDLSTFGWVCCWPSSKLNLSFTFEVTDATLSLGGSLNTFSTSSMCSIAYCTETVTKGVWTNFFSSMRYSKSFELRVDPNLGLNLGSISIETVSLSTVKPRYSIEDWLVFLSISFPHFYFILWKEVAWGIQK